jgi:hypothetical protein
MRLGPNATWSRGCWDRQEGSGLLPEDCAVVTSGECECVLGCVSVWSYAEARPARPLNATIADGRLEPAGTTSIATDAAAASAMIAQETVALLPSAEIRRVRVCGADMYAPRFLDRSPAHSRRWCSMPRCGTARRSASTRPGPGGVGTPRIDRAHRQTECTTDS